MGKRSKIPKTSDTNSRSVSPDDLLGLIRETFEAAVESNDSAVELSCSITRLVSLFASLASEKIADRRLSEAIAQSSLILTRRLNEIMDSVALNNHLHELAKNCNEWPVLALNGRGGFDKAREMVRNLPLAENLSKSLRRESGNPSMDINIFIDNALLGLTFVRTTEGRGTWMAILPLNMTAYKTPLSPDTVDSWTTHIMTMLDNFMGGRKWHELDFENRFPIHSKRTVKGTRSESEGKTVRRVVQSDLKRILKYRLKTASLPNRCENL